MDVAATTAHEQKRDGGSGFAREQGMLPQWAFDAIRPPFKLFSRLVWHMNLKNTENIPPPVGGLIIAVNHQTYIDPFWVSIPIKRPLRYLAWSEAFGWPAVGRLMEWFGAWPLQLEKSDPAAIRRSLHWLRRGGAVMIFPEGRRSLSDGEMCRFKTGTARIALEANVPILPVTIRGANRAWPRGWLLPHSAPIEIIYHPVRRPTPQPGEDIRRCARRETDLLAEVIQSAL